MLSTQIAARTQSDVAAGDGKHKSVTRAEITEQHVEPALVYLLRMYGFDFDIGMAVGTSDRRQLRQDFRQVPKIDMTSQQWKRMCKGEQSGNTATPNKVVLYDMGEGACEAMCKAWQREWSRTFFRKMGTTLQQKVLAIFMALRRESVPGDVGEIVMSYALDKQFF